MKRLKATLDGVEQEQVGLRRSIEDTKHMAAEAESMMLRSRPGRDAAGQDNQPQEQVAGPGAEPPLTA